MTDRLLAGDFLAQWLEMGAELAALREELDPMISQPVLAGEYFQRRGQHDWAEACFGGKGRKPKGVPTRSALVKLLKESDDGGLYRLAELVEDQKIGRGKWQRDKARLVEGQMLKAQQTPEQASYALEKETKKGGYMINHSEFLQSYRREQDKKKK